MKHVYMSTELHQWIKENAAPNEAVEDFLRRKLGLAAREVPRKGPVPRRALLPKRLPGRPMNPTLASVMALKPGEFLPLNLDLVRLGHLAKNALLRLPREARGSAAGWAFTPWQPNDQTQGILRKF